MWEALKTPEVICLLLGISIIILCGVIISMNKRLSEMEKEFHDLQIAYFKIWCKTFSIKEEQEIVKNFTRKKE